MVSATSLASLWRRSVCFSSRFSPHSVVGCRRSCQPLQQQRVVDLWQLDGRRCESPVYSRLFHVFDRRRSNLESVGRSVRADYSKDRCCPQRARTCVLIFTGARASGSSMLVDAIGGITGAAAFAVRIAALVVARLGQLGKLIGKTTTTFF